MIRLDYHVNVSPHHLLYPKVYPNICHKCLKDLLFLYYSNRLNKDSKDENFIQLNKSDRQFTCNGRGLLLNHYIVGIL